MVLAVHPSLSAQTVKDLIAVIKANPGKYSYASGGTWSPGHLVGEQLRLSLGVDLVHVPFNSGGLAIGSTVGGHTPISIVAPAPTVPQVQEGRLRALGVWGASRVGYKISPNGSVYSMSDSDPVRTFSYLATELDHLGLGYLHLTEPIAGPVAVPADVPRALPVLRKMFKGTLIANGGYDARSGNAAIAQGKPISSRSACRSWPIRTLRSVISNVRRSTRRIPRRSMPAKRRATSIIPHLLKSRSFRDDVDHLHHRG
jgi:tripartite tricarboxylate transporter family receptor